jgi:hypothetical protein
MTWERAVRLKGIVERLGWEVYLLSSIDNIKVIEMKRSKDSSNDEARDLI